MPGTDFHSGYTHPKPQPSIPIQIMKAIHRLIVWVIAGVWAVRTPLVLAIFQAGLVGWYGTKALTTLLVLLVPKVRRFGQIMILTAWLRLRHATWKVRWKDYTNDLGWTHIINQQVFTPALTDIDIGDNTTVVELKPLANQRIVSWPEMADALRRLTGHAQASWKETAPGHLQITLHKKPLPTLLELDLGKLATSESRVYLGMLATGDDLFWDPDYTPHVIITGTTGGGKGSALRLIAAHAITTGWQLVVVNPKRSGEFAWTKPHRSTQTCATINNTLQILEDTVAEMFDRQETLDHLGADNWQHPANTKTWQRQLLIIDELPALIVGEDQKPERKQIGVLIGKLAAVGRSAGIHLIIVAQRADTQALGTYGGQLRNNISGRIAVGDLDPDGLRMLFGTLDPDTTRTLDHTKGRALTTQLNQHRPGETAPAQIAWIEQHQLTNHLTETDHRNDEHRIPDPPSNINPDNQNLFSRVAFPFPHTRTPPTNHPGSQPLSRVPPDLNDKPEPTSERKP